MKIALSVFRDCISTVFDVADQLMVLEMDEACGHKRTMVKIDSTDPARRAIQLKDREIDVLICGAISRPMQEAIAAMGVLVYPFVRGSVDEIIAAYTTGRLNSGVFALPGCRSRRQAAGKARQNRGGRCRWK